ncbi:MAG: Stp1/IreP family PP2C-type Ser/Thr phosphatase [Myxococcota bacterium]
MKNVGVGLSDVGQKRTQNEDYLLIRPDLGLYLVADGMGGHAAGEVASRLAAETVARCIEEEKAMLDAFEDSEAAREQLQALVRRAIEQASRAVYEHATSHEGKAGMGTTLSMLLLVKDKAVMGHVGDSRIYLLRAKTLHQLSDDHSYVGELVRRGLLSPEEAEQSPYANVITRAVGIQESVQADTLCFDLLPNDVFLLCSDGLTRHVHAEDELQEMLGNRRLVELPQLLVDLANARGGRDNITVLVMRIPRGEDTQKEERRTTEVNLRVDTLREISLFRHLTMRELLAVMEILRIETFARGKRVMTEGEISDSLYVVLSGRLEVTRHGSHLAELGVGTHFGEMALLNQRPRAATVVAKEAARLLVMDRTNFNELVRRNPTLGVKFLWTFAQVLSLRLDEATLGLSREDPNFADMPFRLP